MKALLSVSLLLLTLSTAVNGQSALEYPMPAGHSNGLVRPGFKIYPRFEFENLGEKHLYLKMDILQLGTAMSPVAPFSYRYMHMGKVYTDQDLGKEPFNSISLGNATFTILVQGPSMNKKVVFSKSPGTVDLGVVSKDALLQYYSAHVQSLDDVFYNGTENVVAAINKFEQTKKDMAKKIADDARKKLAEETPKKTEEPAKPKPADNNNTTTQQKAASSNTSPTNNTNTFGSSTSLNSTAAADKTTTAGAGAKTAAGFGQPIPENANQKNLPDLVRTTDGGYFQRGADGKFREVTAQDYQKAKDAAAASKTTTPPVQQQPKMSEAEVKATVDKMFTDAQKQNDAINASVERFSNMMQQNFYYAEAIRNGKQNLAELSSLSGSYNSIQELEADFNSKYSAIRGQVNELESSRNAALNNAVSNTFNGNSTERAIGEGMQLIGGIINSAKAKKEEKEAKERLRIAREQQIAAIKAAKQKARMELRAQLMKSFPNGGTPLSAHKITVPEVYMFGYIIDKADINNENPKVTVSNVFPVVQYSDGTFPLRTTVSGKLQGISQGDVIIVGYYTDKRAAEQMRNSFVNLAQKSEITVNNFALKTLSSSTSTAVSSGDFWETGQKTKTATSDTTKKKDSFWNN